MSVEISADYFHFLTAGGDRTHELRQACQCPVYVPGDRGYDRARLPWNVAVDQRPAAVAQPTTVADVQTIVRAAACADLRVAPQSTGHAAAALATLHGSSPDVGIVGYSLGGGIGWYAREFGLASNSITAVELVTADGYHVRATSTANPGLFWALRGGGGNFGVVTALEFRLYPIQTAYAGMLVWDVTRAERVLRRWADWAPEAPEAVTTAFRILNLPPLPDVPEPLRGRSLAVIDGAVLGTDGEAERILAPFRELRPEIDTFDRIPARSLARIHLDPQRPTPGVSSAAMLGLLGDDAIDAFLGEVGPGSTSTLLAAELRQLDGALGWVPDEAGALATLEADFALHAVAIAATPELAARGQADATALTTALAPWSTGRQYLNLADQSADPKSGYGEVAWLGLKGMRSALDPDDRFLANHRIPRIFEHGAVTH